MKATKLLVVSLGSLLLSVSAQGATVLAIPSITGFSGGDSFTAGDFTQLTNGAGITKPDVNDPSTWTNTGTGYAEEWYDNHLAGATNGKLGWVSFDLGASTPDLGNLYLFNGNYQTGQLGTATFNIYYAVGPTVALPSPPGANSTVDYDFASGGWTQLGSTRSLAAKANGVYDLSGIPTARYIALELMSTHGTDQRSGFDEVAITAIPEPSAALLGGVGMLLLLRRRK